MATGQVNREAWDKKWGWYYQHDRATLDLFDRGWR